MALWVVREVRPASWPSLLTLSCRCARGWGFVEFTVVLLCISWVWFPAFKSYPRFFTKQTNWGAGQGEGRKKVLPLREKTVAFEVSIKTQVDWGHWATCHSLPLFQSNCTMKDYIPLDCSLALQWRRWVPWTRGKRSLSFSAVSSPQNGVTPGRKELTAARSLRQPGSAPAQPALPVPVHTLWEVTRGVRPGTAPSQATPHRSSWPLLKPCERNPWRDNEEETHRTPVRGLWPLPGPGQSWNQGCGNIQPRVLAEPLPEVPAQPPPPSLTLTALSPLCSLPIFPLRCGLGFSFQGIVHMEECFQWAEALIAK